VELQLFCNDVLLDLTGETVPDFSRSVKTVQEEYATGLGILKHIHPFQERELMAGYKISLVGFDEIRGPDWLRAEAQM
jgi:hypothetical protein